MARMSTPSAHRMTRRPRAAIVMIAITAMACAAALVFRTPVRSRYWAWRIADGTDPAERALYLTALCNAGDGGRWGTGSLLASDDAELRQLGMVVLHHVRSAWAREALLAGLHDPQRNVRELAILGLAVQGDDAIGPKLAEMYRGEDATSAMAACVALERLGSPAAVAVLTELAREPADVARRARLVDALAGIGRAACVPPLAELLRDHRECDVPLRSAEVSRQMVEGLLADGRLGAPLKIPTTQPPPATVAERAAEALVRITGLAPPFSSEASVVEQEHAAEEWLAWCEREAGRP